MVGPAEMPPARLVVRVTARVPRDASVLVAVMKLAVMESPASPPLMVVGPMIVHLAVFAEVPTLVSPRAVTPVTASVPLEMRALLAVIVLAVMVSAVRAFRLQRERGPWS